MSHYEIHYSSTGTRAEREAKARQDCIDYCGSEERYKKICDDLREALHRYPDTNCAFRYRSIQMSLAFAGIQGYWPVRAMARDILSVR